MVNAAGDKKDRQGFRLFYEGISHLMQDEQKRGNRVKQGDRSILIDFMILSKFCISEVNPVCSILKHN